MFVVCVQNLVQSHTRGSCGELAEGVERIVLSLYEELQAVVPFGAFTFAASVGFARGTNSLALGFKMNVGFFGSMVL